MTATASQLVTLFEDCGLTPEQISQDQEIDISVVKLALSQHSTIYRAALREQEETFSEDEYTAAKQAIASLIYAEDEATRLRASKFIVDEVKGRNAIVSKRTGAILGNGTPTTFNILIINQQMQRAREALEKSKSSKLASQILDVESQVSPSKQEKAA